MLIKNFGVNLITMLSWGTCLTLHGAFFTSEWAKFSLAGSLRQPQGSRFSTRIRSIL